MFRRFDGYFGGENLLTRGDRGRVFSSMNQVCSLENYSSCLFSCLGFFARTVKILFNGLLRVAPAKFLSCFMCANSVHAIRCSLVAVQETREEFNNSCIIGGT